MSPKILIIGFVGILTVHVISTQGQGGVTVSGEENQSTISPEPSLCCTYCLESKTPNRLLSLQLPNFHPLCGCVREITVPCDPYWESRPIDGSDQCNKLLNETYPKVVPCGDPQPCCEYCLESKRGGWCEGEGKPFCCDCIKETRLPCLSGPGPQTEGDAQCRGYLSKMYPRNVKCRAEYHRFINCKFDKFLKHNHFD